jgi:hypothetical protein
VTSNHNHLNTVKATKNQRKSPKVEGLKPNNNLSYSYVESDNSFSFNINNDINHEMKINSQKIKTEVEVEAKSLVETMIFDVPTQNRQITNPCVDNNPMTLLANIDLSQISIPNIVHKINSSSITESNTE